MGVVEPGNVLERRKKMSDYLSHIFAFDSSHPLLFTQLYFWVFLAIVYTGFALVVGKTRGRMHLRNVYLMVVSAFFYYKTSGNALGILVFLTVSNWILGLGLGRTDKKWQRGLILATGVLTDLGILCYWKYAYFALDIWNTLTGENLTIAEKIILPVGISFYTFQTISYIVDVYRRQVEPLSNVLDFGFYVSFFPQLVAGPIVRASEFIPQLYRPFFLGRRQFGIAVFWILNGLLKKIILSDYLAVNFVDRVFDSPMLFSGAENAMALLVYSMQVYADFSGYTDIAIGVAMLMGFYLPVNFNSPYKARNPQEFWRRWHCSLSRWLKSYVYIPLGGNRTILGHKAPKLLAGNVNSFATMLIGGLWHGASWNFIIWGALNGVGMIVAKCFPWKIWRPLAVVMTFVFISFTRLFFRASSNLDPDGASQQAWETAKMMLGQITGAWNNAIIPQFLWEYRTVMLLFAAGMAIHWLPTKVKRWYRINFALLPLPLILVAVVVAVFIANYFVTSDLQPFIYFQF